MDKRLEVLVGEERMTWDQDARYVFHTDFRPRWRPQRAQPGSHTVHQPCLRSIGVLWGFGSPHELAAAEPGQTVHDIAQLLRLFR